MLGMVERAAGQLRVGTSGFAYPSWVPRFYPPGTRAGAMLGAYAVRLPALELNNTYHQQAREPRVKAWLDQVPGDFRFTVKAHRNGSLRAFAIDPISTLPWMTDPLRAFGDQLGAVLWRIHGARPPEGLDRLKALLAAWPADLPLAVEFQDPAWDAPEVVETLHAAAVALCVSDLPDADEPSWSVPGPFTYLRLRREEYETEALERWAKRVRAVLEGGRDAYVFFRHDPDGEAPERALDFADRVARLLPADRVTR
jgi:uncharacterized protein YecE (DUF72 family)